MANKYKMKPIVNTFKGGFYLENEEGKMVYEARMKKFKLFNPIPYIFINHITNKTEEHKIGGVVEINVGSSQLEQFLSARSYFKFDGQKIWDYLHDSGVSIDTNISNNKLGMVYTLSLNNEKIATIETSSPKGKSLITTKMIMDITCEEKDLDLAFLVAFSISKTEQTFYS